MMRLWVWGQVSQCRYPQRDQRWEATSVPSALQGAWVRPGGVGMGLAAAGFCWVKRPGLHGLKCKMLGTLRSAQWAPDSRRAPGHWSPVTHCRHGASPPGPAHLKPSCDQKAGSPSLCAHTQKHRRRHNARPDQQSPSGRSSVFYVTSPCCPDCFYTIATLFTHKAPPHSPISSHVSKR